MQAIIDETKFKSDYGIIEEPPVDEKDIVQQEESTWKELWKE